ncbi:hypothetical protein PVAG01_04799 [Phlyctema vagabunda]|uniref:BTB domain-containing protein n=1 Tax=Phlyctema vagabunda TaxID=108571 RepID=A0ABR4PIW5_9HELO
MHEVKASQDLLKLSCRTDLPLKVYKEGPFVFRPIIEVDSSTTVIEILLTRQNFDRTAIEQARIMPRILYNSYISTSASVRSSWDISFSLNHHDDFSIHYYSIHLHRTEICTMPATHATTEAHTIPLFDKDLRDVHLIYDYDAQDSEGKPEKWRYEMWFFSENRIVYRIQGGPMAGRVNYQTASYQCIRPGELWQCNWLEETGTICSLVYDITNKKITTLLGFSQGHWENPEEAHGDKRNPKDLERWRGLAKIVRKEEVAFCASSVERASLNSLSASILLGLRAGNHHILLRYHLQRYVDHTTTMAAKKESRSGGIASLLDSGKYSDLTISCHGRHFKVHKAIVCSSSKPLAAAIDGSFKEAIAGVINLDDDDSEVIASMVKFLYTGIYPDGRLNRPDFQNDADQISWQEHQSQCLLFNAKVYTVADKYDIKLLEDHAAAKYKEILEDGWTGSGFIASMKTAFEMLPSIDKTLKRIITNAAAQHVSMLLTNPEFVALCKESSELSFGCLVAMEKVTPKEFSGRKCRFCKKYS